MGTIDTIPIGNRPTKRSFFVRFARTMLSAPYYAAAMLYLLRVRLAKRQSRLILRELSDEQLRDIGKTRHEAEIEAAKPFWQ